MKTKWRIGFRHDVEWRTPYWEYFTFTGDETEAMRRVQELFENGFKKISLEKNYVKKVREKNV